MSLHTELMQLKKRRWKMEESGVRIFYDGSIRTHTITGSGRRGWYIVAKGIPGAAQLFGQYFEGGGKDDRYLGVKDLRRAILLRDLIFAEVMDGKLSSKLSNL